MRVETLAGNPISIVGKNPNGGFQPQQIINISQQGTAAFEWKGVSGFINVGKKSLLGTLTVDVKDDDFQLKQFSLLFGGLLESISQLTIEQVRDEGVVASATTLYGGNVTTFLNLPIILRKEEVAVLNVYVTLKPKSSSFYNERIQVNLTSGVPMELVSVANGDKYYQTDLGTTEFPLTNTMADLFVKFSDVTFSLLQGSPSGPVGRNQAQEVMRFRITADQAGGIRIKRLTFKLEPGDVNTALANNDALERWATVNGDGPDDNDLVNLWRLDIPGSDPIGEDQNARLKYSVVQGGVKDETPVGIISAPNDYGLIEYIFNQDQEIRVSAGSSADFRLEIDTTRFALGEHSFSIEILGGSDIEWTDLEIGNYTPITGTIVPGLPLESYSMMVQP